LENVPMQIGRSILLGLLGLVMAEAAVFLSVAWIFGSFTAISALLATSILGMLILARMGRRFAGRVADVLTRRDFAAPATRSSGFLTTLGGILLVLPGFITDCAGLLLLIPALQRWLIERVPIGRRRPAGHVLDLDRSQWQNLPDRHIADERKDQSKNQPKVPPKRSRRR
jgi:UPF0716 protein FxsA